MRCVYAANSSWKNGLWGKNEVNIKPWGAGRHVSKQEKGDMDILGSASCSYITTTHTYFSSVGQFELFLSF